MAKCDCYFQHGTKFLCYGTKEMEECSCGGDESKCNFYPEKRKRKMANEKRLIDANALVPYLWALFKFFGSIPRTEADKATQRGIRRCIGEIKKMPTVDAVPMEQYMALREQYHELRENFIDYVCSGTCNAAPYCLNRCEGCVDRVGWCSQGSDECQGFNPAEVILDGAKMDGVGNA